MLSDIRVLVRSAIPAIVLMIFSVLLLDSAGAAKEDGRI
jgi:hypothetical protein